jgi:hypothetical protein
MSTAENRTINSQPFVPQIFARHETFHPRYGWLKKGFDAASRNSHIFSSDNAHIELGVGKNMVKAIRYWSFAFKLIDEVQQNGQRSRTYVPSELGKKLLGEDGWDPYIEDPATLWLLHWNLLKPPCHATAWYATFNYFHQNIFTADDLLEAIKDYSEQASKKSRATDSSINKDVHCLLRMYTASSSKKLLKEDSLDCPFSELGILKHIQDAKHYSFNMGSKFGIAPEIIVAACLDFVSSTEDSAKTISISRLLYDIGSPGLVLKLTESSLCDAIEQVSSDKKEVALSETAGLIQLSFAQDPSVLKDDILSSYYDD